MPMRGSVLRYPAISERGLLIDLQGQAERGCNEPDHHRRDQQGSLDRHFSNVKHDEHCENADDDVADKPWNRFESERVQGIV